MSDLQVDVEVIRSVAASLTEASGLVPTTLAADASGCGSPVVLAAIEELNMWAKVSFMTLAGRLTMQANDASGAATLYEQQDADLAAGTGG